MRERPRGLAGWLTTVDHEEVGVLYLVFGTVMGLWGALDAMMIRTALLTPGPDIYAIRTYNALFTTHGLTMLFLFATPVLFGLANVVVPRLVGAPDMAFPRINAFAFWLLPPAAVLMRAGIISDLLFGGLFGSPTMGWTMYPPLSSQMGNPAIDLTLIGLHLSGVSTIAAAINFLVTIVVESEEAVNWATLDIFSWTMVATSGLVVFAFPILGATVLMLLADRTLGTVFFAFQDGAILFQHLFWFFGHPEVYILVLPPMGIVSYVLPRFAGRRLFGFRAIVYSTLAIAVLSFGVWAHHMFATGIDPRIQASFMAVTLAIAIPSAIKTFNWMATLWNGAVRLTVPMLFCLGAVGNFVIGGITGVFLAAIPVDLQYHGTYYVVGHFHFMLVGLVVFGAFAGCYYWYPLITGRMYDPFLGRVHFGLSAIGVVLAFLLMMLLGIEGLPRRMATYPPEFATLQRLVTVGAFLIGAGQLVWLWNVLRSLEEGEPVSGDVWGLRERGLVAREWDPDQEPADR